ncbi:hypothetical protein DL98DRAFT_600661 [Cadophora sp. DSE1049]|nr:hypothetical protein DL98DRAFT_600661 [Cadophora sp. DSE1049]
MLNLSVRLQNAFCWSITTNKSAQEAEDLRRLLELPTLEGHPFLGVPVTVLGRIASFGKQDSGSSNSNVVIPIMSGCSWAVRGFRDLNYFPKDGSISTAHSYMLVDFPPQTQLSKEILAFGFDSESSGDGWVPMEAKENDVICELHKEQNLHVVLRPADDRYLIVGRAMVTNTDRLCSPNLLPTQSSPDNLTLYMSSGVLQLLTCPAPAKISGP